MLSVDEDTFEKVVLKSDKIVIIDFWAPWCMPCQMMSPVFEEVSLEMPDYKFVKLNVQENQRLASEFLVKGIPTIVLMKDGEELGRFSGFRPKQDLMNEIKELIIKSGN